LERVDEHEPMVEKTRVETVRSKGRGVKMSRRKHRCRIKPMDSDLAMGLFGRPTIALTSSSSWSTITITEVVKGW
jgi:hypothetical protein